MSWCGWDEQTTLDTSMSSIVLAYEGKKEMLRAIFGGGKGGTTTGVSNPVAANDVAGVRALLRGFGAKA